MNTSQYFSHDPAVKSSPSQIRVDLHDGVWDMTTDRGIFSHTTLDPGTHVLLDKAPAPNQEGPILDLGCGWGPITVVWATREPQRDVWAVDVNSRARSVTQANAHAHDCARVHVTAPDDVPSATRFAAIYSNPPIKVGKQTVHAMCQRWLPTLLPGGVAYFVVSKHLGADSLARWLRDQEWDVQRTASKRGYRVLAITAPST